MSKLIIFGTGQLAEIAFYYFTKDSPYKIEAFVVDDNFVKENLFQNKPVIPFSDLNTNDFKSTEYSFFVATSYSKMNDFRKKKYFDIKNLGYKFVNYISSKSSIFTDKIGENCFILENNVIQPFVIIKDNVTLWSGNHIGHHSVIESHVFISSHVVISGNCTIGESTFIGVNSSIANGVKIGKSNFLNLHTCIKKDTADNSVFNSKQSEVLKINSKNLL